MKAHGAEWHYGKAMRLLRAANRARISGDDSSARKHGAEAMKHLRVHTALWLGGTPEEIRGTKKGPVLTVSNGIAGVQPARVQIIPPL